MLRVLKRGYILMILEYALLQVSHNKHFYIVAENELIGNHLKKDVFAKQSRCSILVLIF